MRTMRWIESKSLFWLFYRIICYPLHSLQALYFKFCKIC